MLFPLGEYGVLLAASPDVGAFSERDISLGRILAANIQSALAQVHREAQLREREASLARQNERLDEFASIVSHDLRTPLDLAGVHLELAREGRDADDHLQKVAAAHDRMADLIDDVLTWAREGDAVEATERVSLRRLVEECWADHPTAEATLQVETERAVRADRGRLKQVFDNLLDNALAYAGETATVTVGDMEGGVYVADDGPGIPEAEREAVFNSGHTLSMEGTGFGLAIVRQIVEAHDWEISLTESDRGGARFEIRF
jgi:signal transduction histidine kinase